MARGVLTSWLEPNSLAGLTPIDRGPGEGGRCRGLDDHGSDKDGKLESVAKEGVLTNEMAILPSPCAGHNPRPGSAPEVETVAPITNICVSDCSGGNAKGKRTRTPWLEGRQRCEK